MKKIKKVFSAFIILFVLISGLSACETKETESTSGNQKILQETETPLNDNSSKNHSKVTIEKSETKTNTENRTDQNMVGIYLLRYDQRKGEKRRNVDHLINQGLKMTAHFYEDGRGYIIPGTGIEEFTWGNGIIVKGRHTMTYTLDGNTLIVEEQESGSKYWYERTDEELTEYPDFSNEVFP